MDSTTTTASREPQRQAQLSGVNNLQIPAPKPSLLEIKQQELEQEICRCFEAVTAEYPSASWYLRTVKVAAVTGLSPEGIKKILERNGITNPRKRTAKKSKK